METSDLENVLRCVVGITIFTAGIAKIKSPSRFVQGVLDYQVLPPVFARLYGYILPFAEICTGIFLAVGIWVGLTALIADVMFVSFAIAVAINLWRKRKMPCFCFGTDMSDDMGGHTLARIFLLMGFTTILAYIWPLEAATKSYFHFPSMIELVNSIPTILLVVFGLSILSIIEVSPWVIKAWTAPAIRPTQNRINVVWTHEEGDHS